MRIKRKIKEESPANAVLSDLAFLLIIYFIVISGFNVNKGFLMTLPAKDSARLLLKEDILRYELNEAGEIISDGRTVGIGRASRDIADAVKGRPNLAVLLTVAPNAPWKNVVSFIELAEKSKVESFSFKMMNGEAQ
jgi:biopolymer transport protein ExbD